MWTGVCPPFFWPTVTRTVGVASMEHLLAWRMEISQDFLRREAPGHHSPGSTRGQDSQQAVEVNNALHARAQD